MFLHTHKSPDHWGVLLADQDSAGLGGAWAAAFLTSFQAKLMLLINKEQSLSEVCLGKCSRNNKRVNQKQRPQRTEENCRSLGWCVGKRENSILERGGKTQAKVRHEHTGQSQYSTAVCLKEDKNTPKPYHHLIAGMTGLCNSLRGAQVSDWWPKNKSEEGITSLPT